MKSHIILIHSIVMASAALLLPPANNQPVDILDPWFNRPAKPIENLEDYTTTGSPQVQVNAPSFHGEADCGNPQLSGPVDLSCHTIETSGEWTKSINPNGNCLTLYDGVDCLGEEVFTVQNGTYTCLNTFELYNNLTSFRICDGRKNSVTVG